MDILSSFPTKYLQKQDFAQPRTVIIDTVVMEDVSLDNQPAEMKPVIYFKGSSKGMILNKTNANILTAILGTSMTEQWTGKTIEAYDDPAIQFQGKLVGGIRLRAVASANNPGQPADAPFNDPIPGQDVTW